MINNKEINCFVEMMSPFLQPPPTFPANIPTTSLITPSAAPTIPTSTPSFGTTMILTTTKSPKEIVYSGPFGYYYLDGLLVVFRCASQGLPCGSINYDKYEMKYCFMNYSYHILHYSCDLLCYDDLEFYFQCNCITIKFALFYCTRLYFALDLGRHELLLININGLHKSSLVFLKKFLAQKFISISSNSFNDNFSIFRKSCLDEQCCWHENTFDKRGQCILPAVNVTKLSSPLSELLGD